MFLRIFLSFLFFKLLSFTCPGQHQPAQFPELPVRFLNIVKSYPLLNPSYAAVDSGVNLISGNRMNFGSFKIYRTNYLSLTFRVPFSRDSGNHHGFGFAALTDRQGEYIHHNRFYFTYAYKIRLAKYVSLSTGLSIGLVNHAIESTNINTGGSALAPDGNAGVWIYGRKTYLGFSLNQLFNSRLTPFTETAILSRHFNITAGRKFDLGPNLQLSSSLVIRGGSGIKAETDIVNQFLIQRILSAGFNYRHHQGIVLIAGLENLPFRMGRHLAGGWFSYNIPFSKYVSGAPQTYEITLTYKLL